MTTTIELARDKGWGTRTLIRVENTPEAEAAVLDYLHRVCPDDWKLGDNYHVPTVLEDQTDGDMGQELYDYFYPTCEHGLSAALCVGPGHYPTDKQLGY